MLRAPRRSSAGIRTCIVMYRRPPCLPRTRECDKKPSAVDEQHAKHKNAYFTDKLRSPAMLVKTHVASPASTNSQRLPTKPAREELAIVCASTGPVGTGLGAVCVERRGQWRTHIGWVDCLVAWLSTEKLKNNTTLGVLCVRSSNSTLLDLNNPSHTKFKQFSPEKGFR